MGAVKVGSNNSKAIAISIVAIVIAVASIALFFSARPSAASASQREFFLVTPELDFNETLIGIPHYVFMPTQLTVNQGDDVLIHFFNTADDTNHTFTVPAYGINVNLAPGEHKDIQFTADQAGVFSFNCQFHPSTMRGELIVLHS